MMTSEILCVLVFISKNGERERNGLNTHSIAATIHHRKCINVNQQQMHLNAGFLSFRISNHFAEGECNLQDESKKEVKKD